MTTRVGLVTGGATGIGAATARLLADQQIKVAVCDINQEVGSSIAEEIGGIFIPCDVTDLASVEQASKMCAEQIGEPDYVHLNAGIMTVPTGDDFLPIEEVSLEQYRRIIGVNLDGVFFGVKTFLPGVRSKGGAITITASVAAFGMLPIDPLYSATKHSLVGFARSIAAANEGSGLRLNVICPGVVDTAIVPDAFQSPDMMSPQVLAEDIVDLLLHGANGEIRAKVSPDRVIVVDPIDVMST